MKLEDVLHLKQFPYQTSFVVELHNGSLGFLVRSSFIIFNPETNKELKRFTLESHCTSIAILKDGYLAVGGIAIEIYNTETGQKINKFGEFWRYDSTCSGLASLQDGTLVSGNGLGNNIDVWDVKTGKCLRSFNTSGNYTSSLVVLLDGSLVRSWWGQIDIWDAIKGIKLKKLECKGNPLAVLRDGSLIIGQYKNIIARGGFCLYLYQRNP